MPKWGKAPQGTTTVQGRHLRGDKEKVFFTNSREKGESSLSRLKERLFLEGGKEEAFLTSRKKKQCLIVKSLLSARNLYKKAGKTPL